ncbi:hypothetical protein [Nocardia sp. CC201C]|uniref:hypothetical protein n=1 Tax=Nocardia sp. CC201C TaxID=3044575 RepID=UPI0024A8F436|nr:hypothetical protein [Nocardia sp. CC201C]
MRMTAWRIVAYPLLTACALWIWSGYPHRDAAFAVALAIPLLVTIGLDITTTVWARRILAEGRPKANLDPEVEP